MAKNNFSKVAIGAVIFPANLEFFEDFLQSLQRQTEKNFRLVLFNDGCDHQELEKQLKPFEAIKYDIVNATKTTPSEIRVELIEHIKAEQYEIIIFADTDDCFSKDRVASSIEKLKDNVDIVVNDLSLISKDGALIRDRVWKNRFSDLKVDLEFLMQQNVLGLGNTAINTKLLQFKIQADTNIPFFDWAFYLQLFHHTEGIKCATIEATTYYRQHGSNMLGLGAEITLERLEKLWDIKKRMYSFAKKLDLPNIDMYISKHNSFKKEVLENPERAKEHILRLNNLEDLFWFEEINTINERNTA